MELIHTCYRVTDPERSIAFYEALGLERRRELPIRDEAVNYFLGVPGQEIPELDPTKGGTLIGSSRDYIDANQGHELDLITERLKARQMMDNTSEEFSKSVAVLTSASTPAPPPQHRNVLKEPPHAQ